MPEGLWKAYQQRKRIVYVFYQNNFYFCYVNFFELKTTLCLKSCFNLFNPQNWRPCRKKRFEKRWWKFYTVIGWFGGEIIGIVLSILIFQTEETLALLPLGYAFAIGSYFILRAVLSKKPDVETPGFEFEGAEPTALK
jgi:hypothetical protein